MTSVEVAAAEPDGTGGDGGARDHGGDQGGEALDLGHLFAESLAVTLTEQALGPTGMGGRAFGALVNLGQRIEPFRLGALGLGLPSLRHAGG